MKELKEQVVSFEVAKLAKEKKFNVPISKIYSCDYGDPQLTTGIDGGGKIVSNKMWGDRKCYSAPTQSLLQKWLREKKNIDVQPYLIEVSSGSRQMEQAKSDKEYTCKVLHKGVSQYIRYESELSYEEAFERGLKKALELI